MNNDKIELREVKEDDFRKGILSGEVSPHDVDISIKYKNGKTTGITIKWDTILDLYKYHNKNAVGEMYEMTVDWMV